MDNEKTVVRYCLGTGRNFGKGKNKASSWKSFKGLFKKPTRTSERFKDYLKLPDQEQGALKSVDGWVYRTQIEGKSRNRGSGMPSDMVTFDFDYATPQYLEEMLNGEFCPELDWFLHTSRRHTEEKPRYRLFVLLESPVPNELYIPVSRILATKFDPDMTHVDKVSFRPAQMMFRPTASADSEFIFHENPGERLDWNLLLDEYEKQGRDWRDITQLPKVPDEELRETADKAEDPTEKQGPVGDFCRAYDVVEAIEKFLPDKYIPVDMHTGKPRYTYAGGTTVNGAEVQDDGLFLYSHHGSDPTSDMLVNSFDLVRIHLFGDKDEKFDTKGEPIAKWPSFKEMMEFIKDDEGYKRSLIASRYDYEAMSQDFDEGTDFEPEVDEDHDSEIADLVGRPAHTGREPDVGEPSELDDMLSDLPETGLHDETPEISAEAPPMPIGRVKRPPPKKGWQLDLEYTKDGGIIQNAANLTQIVQNDARVRYAVEFNEFQNRVVTREPVKTKMPYVPIFPIKNTIDGDPWQDHHTDAVRVMMEAPNGPGKPGWGVKVTDRDMTTAINISARHNVFHPVREYLSALEHDGVSRVEELWIKYMGTPDTPYYRETARKFLIGCVARAYEPGHKFDFVPILHGAQGKRKSTFVAILARSWAGELKGNFSDEKHLVEQMIGCWLMELPELSSITRSQIEDVKAFISGTESTVRLSYGRLPTVFPRQCCFLGSTNDDEFLIDHTGNRRWWPIKVLAAMVDTDELAREVDQIWAEAAAMYRAMREEQPHGALPLFLADPESQADAMELQEKARLHTEADSYAEMISEWLDEEIPINDHFEHDDTRAAVRKYVCISQVWTEALENQSRMTQADSRAVGKALKSLGWLPVGSVRIPGYGVAKGFCRSVQAQAKLEAALEIDKMDPDDLV